MFYIGCTTMTNDGRPTSLNLQFPATCSRVALTPTEDALPSRILPHLFVGTQGQTNRDTLNRLNINYILSLGLLPLISNSRVSPTTPISPTASTSTTSPTAPISPTTSISPILPTNPVSPTPLLPSQNSSRDFKIRLRALEDGLGNENKGVKAVRSIHCKCINIEDKSEQNIAEFFEEAHQFIDEARRKKCNILIHCSAGISRSPTIAISYLMRVNSLRLPDAYNLVKQCRPQIEPSFSFMVQLMDYEKSIVPNSKGSYHSNSNRNPYYYLLYK